MDDVELVELAAEDGFRIVGVDTNDLQLEEARRHGCAVIHGEALGHLRSLETQSVLAVTGIHIVEHIPFPDLAVLTREVARVVMKGGVVIFETPNPRNLIVGATTFHFDPTHIRPCRPKSCNCCWRRSASPRSRPGRCIPRRRSNTWSARAISIVISRPCCSGRRTTPPSA